MQKKLIDIFPPRRFHDSPLELSEETQNNKRPPSKTRGIQIFVLILVLLGLPLAGIHFFLAKAQIVVSPQVTEMHMVGQIFAQEGQNTIQFENNVIPAKKFEQDREGTRVFSATGKEVREEKAQGTIRVYNTNSSSTQTLVANTRFISEDGKLFRSTEKVSVPGMQSNGDPGFIDVKVIAAEVGKEYNIGPSNFSLPGLVGTPLYTKIYGKSSEPIQGGAVGEVAVVTQKDIDTAKEALVQELTADAKKALIARVPEGFEILDASFSTELLEDNTLVKEGSVLEEFTYNAKVRVTSLVFSREDMYLLADQLIRAHLQDSEEIKENSLTVNYQNVGINKGSGQLSVNADISVQKYTKVDMLELEQSFRGAGKSDLNSILSEYPSLANAQFSLWPFWLQKVPENLLNLTIKLNI